MITRFWKPGWWASASLLFMVVGAFAPWAKVVGGPVVLSVKGTDVRGDGWLVIVAAAVGALFLLIHAKARKGWLLVLPILAGCAGAATPAFDISYIQNRSGSFGGWASAGTAWGLYVALAGSVSLVLASLALALDRTPRLPQAESEPRRQPRVPLVPSPHAEALKRAPPPS